MAFDDNLRQRRRQLGQTQEELAGKLGMKQSTIACYETGEREPGFQTLVKLAKCLGVTPNDLLGWRDESGHGSRQSETETDETALTRTGFIQIHRIIRGKNGDADTTTESWINTDHIISIEPGGLYPGTRIILQGNYIRAEENAAELLARITEARKNKF
jgi:transcriptional regulator with XRE-family HTH domain